MIPTRLRRLPLALAFLVLPACGPVQSTAQLLDADAQLRAAREAGAEEHAPYEWTAATLYLQKAREEVGYSEYDVALQYARKSARFAVEAREKATAAKSGASSQGSR